MPRSDTLLRRVLRWTPSERAERQKFPRFDLRDATMNCRSNSRLACSSVTPRRTSSSTMRNRRPLRVCSAKSCTLAEKKDRKQTAYHRHSGARVSRCFLFWIEPVAEMDRVPRLDDPRHREVLVYREHGELAENDGRHPRPVLAIDGVDVAGRRILLADHVVHIDIG